MSILNARSPLDSFVPFLKIEDNHEYTIEKLGDYYYIHTNWQAKNFRLMRVNKDTTSDKTSWQPVIEHREGVYLQDFTIFKNAAVIKEKENGENRIKVLLFNTGKILELKFDDPVFSIRIADNPEVSSDVVRIDYSSLTTPPSVYEYKLINGE